MAMKLRKGNRIVFKSNGRTEEIISTKSPSDNINGIIMTDKNEYSVDFLKRWRQFGFIEILKNKK